MMSTRVVCLSLVLLFLAFAVTEGVSISSVRARKLLQSSATSGSPTSGTSAGGLSTETEDVPSQLSDSNIVTESYRNWDGESADANFSVGNILGTVGSILGGLLLIALVVGVVVAIVAGVLFVMKKQKAKKAKDGDYVLMENDMNLA